MAQIWADWGVPEGEDAVRVNTGFALLHVLVAVQLVAVGVVPLTEIAEHPVIDDPASSPAAVNPGVLLPPVNVTRLDTVPLVQGRDTSMDPAVTVVLLSHT